MFNTHYSTLLLSFQGIHLLMNHKKVILRYSASCDISVSRCPGMSRLFYIERCMYTVRWSHTPHTHTHINTPAYSDIGYFLSRIVIENAEGQIHLKEQELHVVC